jgi:hypothetical protein
MNRVRETVPCLESSMIVIYIFGGLLFALGLFALNAYLGREGFVQPISHPMPKADYDLIIASIIMGMVLLLFVLGAGGITVIRRTEVQNVPVSGYCVPNSQHDCCVTNNIRHSCPVDPNSPG